MIDEKNLDAEAADKIGYYVRMSGGVDLIDTLLTSDLVYFSQLERALTGIIKDCHL